MSDKLQMQRREYSHQGWMCVLLVKMLKTRGKQEQKHQRNCRYEGIIRQEKCSNILSSTRSELQEKLKRSMPIDKDKYLVKNWFRNKCSSVGLGAFYGARGPEFEHQRRHTC